MQIQIWIRDLHNLTLDFYESFIVINNRQSFISTNTLLKTKNMEIHGTNDDSWSDLWNDKRITKIFDWIVDSCNPLSRDKVDYIYNQI